MLTKVEFQGKFRTERVKSRGGGTRHVLGWGCMKMSRSGGEGHRVENGDFSAFAWRGSVQISLLISPKTVEDHLF